MLNKAFYIGSYEKAFPEDISIQQMINMSAEYGYDFFEISIDRTENRINRLYDKEFQNQLENILRQSPIKIESVCLSALGTYTLGNPDATIRERAIDIFKQAILFAKRFGVRIVQIPGCDIPKFDKSTVETDRQFLVNLRQMIEFAAIHGILVAIENMENDYMDTVAKCMRAVDYVKSPYLQLYPDAGNITSAAFLSNGDIRQDMICGKGHYVAFHLKETKSNKYGGLFYGEGHVNFELLTNYAWQLGVRRFVMEYWCIIKEGWQERLQIANDLCNIWINKAMKIRKC